MGDGYIIAIDFGTAYSGYAYSVTPKEKEIEPILKKWGQEEGLDTPKTPTSILFDEHGEFMKFGYEAKAAYINVHGEEAKKQYFFENFKMALYGRVSMNSMSVFLKFIYVLSMWCRLKPVCRAEFLLLSAQA